MKKIILIAFLGLNYLFGEVLYLNYLEFENLVFKRNPILKENAVDIEKQIQKLHRLEMATLLPDFEIEMAMGPAPGLKINYDTNKIYQNQNVTPDLWWKTSSRVFDFEHWGPFFGFEGSLTQPLNIHRYRSGHRAASLNVKISREEFYKEQMKISLQSQEIYYGFLLADKMLKEVNQASKDFNEAEEKIEEMLDEDDESISQKDLLKLRTGFFDLEKGKNKAIVGLRRAGKYAGFFLALEDTSAFRPADSVLSKSSLVLPPLDTLQIWLIRHHPDLKRLENGLAARRELINVARGEIGPDLAIFGKVNYAKAWSSKRESGGEDVFTRDPMNELDGIVGLGLRLHLNFWYRYQKLKKEKLELKHLKRKEAYAVKGLLLKLEEAYLEFEEARSNAKAASKSLRAAEAWLKGAAMAYDLDPSQTKDMMSAYKTTILAKEDYYTSVFNYNLALGKVIHDCGWTYTDFLGNIKKRGEN